VATCPAKPEARRRKRKPTTSVFAAAEGRSFQWAMYLVRSYQPAQFLLESSLPECIRLRIACFLGIWI
jgi:hypothetical protein